MSDYTSLLNIAYQNLLNQFTILMEFTPSKVNQITSIINPQTSTWNTVISDNSITLATTTPLGSLSTHLTTELNNIQSSAGSDPSLNLLLSPNADKGMVLLPNGLYIQQSNFLDMLDIVVPNAESTINSLITDSNLLNVLILLRQYNRYLNGVNIFTNLPQFATYENSLVNVGIVTTPQLSNIENTLNINTVGLNFTQLTSGNSNISGSDLETCFNNYLNVIEMDWSSYNNLKNLYRPILT